MRNLTISQSITNRSDASINLYFKDVSKLPMISPEEEIELSKKIQNGDKTAESKLVKANLRFVISVAKQYQNKGLDLVDLIQEGNLGLIEGARRYNPDRGIKFISYAVWWIRQSILKAISDQCRTVRVPMGQIVNMNKISKVSEKFEQEHGRNPSTIELEDLVNLDSKKIGLSFSSTYKSVSLESPFSDGENGNLLDIIPNTNADECDKGLYQNDLIKIMDKIISKLPCRDSDVIRLLYGIGTQQMTIDEIANRFGVGCERIRQIQHNAIKRLRTKYKKELFELL